MQNFIEVYKGLFSKEYCEMVIENFNIFQKEGFDINRQQREQASKLNKDDSAIFLPSLDISHCSASKSGNISQEFANLFWAIAYKNYAEKYSMVSELGGHNIYGVKIQKTMPGQGYHEWHCESSSRNSCHRILAWAVYLNDDFEAGETEFLYQQYRYTPNQGDVVIFPAAFTHTHRGNPPINGTKYIMTGWVEF